MKIYSDSTYTTLLDTLTITNSTAYRHYSPFKAKNTGVDNSNLTSSCSSYWRLNDNASSSTVIDYCGSNTGSLRANDTAINTSTVTTTGKLNQAFTFNGTTNERNIAAGGIFDLLYNDSVTYVAWIKTSASGENTIVSNFENNSVGKGHIFQTDSDDICWIFSYSISANNWLYECTSSLGVNDNSWWMVAVTYDGSGTQAGTKFYASKTGTISEYTSTTGNGTSITTNPTGEYAFCIGARCSATGSKAQEFTGTIDQVQRFNRILSLAEIQTLYNGGVGTESLGGIYMSGQVEDVELNVDEPPPPTPTGHTETGQTFGGCSIR
jgi:hypothetical protein